MLTRIKNFPELEQASRVGEILKNTLTRENMAIETAFFSRDINASFERTYGWNWFLNPSIRLLFFLIKSAFQ